MIRRLKALVDAQEFPWLPPWCPGRTPRERAVRRLRAISLARLRRADIIPPAALALRCLAWPFLLPVKAWLAARGRPREALRHAVDLLAHNIRPGALRPLRELRPAEPRIAALFVTDRENQALAATALAGSPSASIGAKRAFARFCREHALPAIPVLAEGRGSRVERVECPEAWPAADLFAKRDGLWGGQGAAILAHDPATGRWTAPDGEPVGRETLADWSARAHPDADWVVQARLAIDPAWADWSPGGLGTVRVVTVIVGPGDPPEIVAASMRLPRAGMVVDNFSAGALSAEIDHRSGVLGPALSRDPRRPWHARHPDTGRPISGRPVPRWDELAALALRAHAAAPDLPSVGWDLCLHRGEPLLVEANPVWNIAPTVVLGETRWLEAMLRRFPAAEPATETVL